MRLLFGPIQGEGINVDLSPDPANPFVHLYHPVLDPFDCNQGTSKWFQPRGPRVFDTWSSRFSAGGVPDYSTWNVPKTAPCIPMYSAAAGTGPIVQAIQITIRVWDQKTSLTRQITIVQAL